MGLQATARNETLAKLSPEQVNLALTEARKTGSGAVVNGIELSLGELQRASHANESQDLALRSRELALESQSVALADQHETKIIENMTTAQQIAAIQAGGTHQGQQLNLTKLTEGLKISKQREQLLVDNASQQGLGDLYAQTANAVTGGGKNAMIRAKMLFGSTPKTQVGLLGAHAIRIMQMNEAIAEANKSGTGQAMIQKLMPELNAMLQAQDKAIDSVVTRWAGGDKGLLAVGNAWLRGEPLTDAGAAKGLISMARNGMPGGTNMTGPAAQVFKRVQQIVQEHDSPKPKSECQCGRFVRRQEQKQRECAGASVDSVML